MAKQIKLVMVGDGGCGKTTAFITYTSGSLPGEYIPMVFDNYTANVMHNEQLVSLGLWDTGGRSDYDRLRPLSYPQTDVFVLLYSVVNPSSFERVTSLWLPELNHHCPKTPIILVGSKIDLRDDSAVRANLSVKQQTPLSYEDGRLLADQNRALNVIDFLEFSSVTQEGLKQLFTTAMDVVLKPPKNNNTGGNAGKKGKKECILL